MSRGCISRIEYEYIYAIIIIIIQPPSTLLYIADRSQSRYIRNKHVVNIYGIKYTRWEILVNIKSWSSAFMVVSFVRDRKEVCDGSHAFIALSIFMNHSRVSMYIFVKGSSSIFYVEWIILILKYYMIRQSFNNLNIHLNLIYIWKNWTFLWHVKLN